MFGVYGVGRGSVVRSLEGKDFVAWRGANVVCGAWSCQRCYFGRYILRI